jgi:hypothetical protein
MFCYCLYGWGLVIISAPLLYWAIALGIAVLLSIAVTYSFLASIPATLAASVLVITPMTLDVSIIRGNLFLQALANNFRNMFLFGVLAFTISLMWFSPLFWTHRSLVKTNLSKRQIAGFLTAFSWLGLGLGRLLGIWY